MIDVRGIAVAVTDTGGDGTPVVMLHGNPDTRHAWEGVMTALGDDFRCIAPDFPGFGDSAEPPPDFDFLPAGQAAFWSAFADAVGLDAPFVVAVHDFAVPWMLPFVAAHPERVRGLVVSNGPFSRDYRWHGWARAWQTPVLGELTSFPVPRWVFRRELRRGDPAIPLSYVDASFEHMHARARRTVLRTYRAWADFAAAVGDWPERLRAATADIPTRVLWGDLDPFIPVRHADDFGGEVVHLPDVGHWTYISRPERYADQVRAVARGPGVDPVLEGRATAGDPTG